MKKFLISLAVSCAFFLGANAQNRGDLVNYELLADKNTDQIDEILSGSTGIPSIFLGFLIPTTYDVRVYKLVYHTVDGRGNPTIASGAMYVPKPNPCGAPLVAYLHGTIIDEISVPSNLEGVEGAIGWAMATDGYVAALPDYIGLGESPGDHPYVHAKSEATASIDMMRAARKVCDELGVGLNGQVFISGYSQGGHSTLATQREIEKQHSSEFNLEFVAAGAGPYDLSGTQKDFAFDNDFYTNPSFLPYVLQGYQEVYRNIYGSLSDVYVDPYDDQIPILLDGSLSVEEIDAQLPANWKTMFKSDFLNAVENNYFHPANVALRKNNLYAWSPKTKTRLYYCTSDEQVDPANSLVAWFNFFLRGAGGRVAAIPLGPFKHRDCAPFALLVSKAKFDERRNDSFCQQAARIERTELEELNENLKSLVNETGIPDMDAQLRDSGLDHLADALKENEKNWINMYPNPANNFGTLNFHDLSEEVRSVTVMTLSGKAIMNVQYVLDGNEVRVDLSGLNSGAYILAVEADKIYHVSFVKQ